LLEPLIEANGRALLEERDNRRWLLFAFAITLLQVVWVRRTPEASHECSPIARPRKREPRMLQQAGVRERPDSIVVLGLKAYVGAQLRPDLNDLTYGQSMFDPRRKPLYSFRHDCHPAHFPNRRCHHAQQLE
jgi:hypothetical protein